MHVVEDLEQLRIGYERALATYEGVSATLNRHILAGSKPSAAELQRERDARAQLEAARRRYLEAWMLP